MQRLRAFHRRSRRHSDSGLVALAVAVVISLSAGTLAFSINPLLDPMQSRASEASATGLRVSTTPSTQVELAAGGLTCNTFAPGGLFTMAETDSGCSGGSVGTLPNGTTTPRVVGFATTNLSIVSTDNLRLVFSTAQSGFLIVSSTSFDLGSGGSFSTPSNAQAQSMTSSAEWSDPVNLGSQYVLVLVDASPGTCQDAAVVSAMYVDGNALSISFTGRSGCSGDSDSATFSFTTSAVPVSPSSSPGVSPWVYGVIVVVVVAIVIGGAAAILRRRRSSKSPVPSPSAAGGTVTPSSPAPPEPALQTATPSVSTGVPIPAAPILAVQGQVITPAPPPQSPPARPEPLPAERYCTSCGAGNALVSAFCTSCGKPLATFAPPPPVGPPTVVPTAFVPPSGPVAFGGEFASVGTVHAYPGFSAKGWPSFTRVAAVLGLVLALGIGLVFVPVTSAVGAGLALLGFFGLFFGWSFWGVIPNRRVRALRKAIERTGVRVYTEPSIDSRGVRFALTVAVEANTYATTMERLVAAGIRPEKYSIPLIRAYSLQFAKGILKKMNYLIFLNPSGEGLYVSTMSNVNVGLARYRKVWFASLEASPFLSSLYGTIR